MAKNDKRIYYIIGGIILVGGAAAFIIVNKQKKKKQIKLINDILDAKVADPNGNPGQKVITSAQLNTLPDGQFPLKFKDKNKKVYALQQALNSKWGANIDLDGVFGQSTATALCKYIFHLCETDVQSRLYTISNQDFNDILNKKQIWR